MKKICTLCKEEKEVSEFGPRKRSKDGLMYRCRPCVSKLKIIWRKNNPEKVKKYAKKTRERHGARYNQMYKTSIWSVYTCRARKKNIPFELSREDFESLLKLDCFYCLDEGGGVDRIDNSKGYTLENSVPCCSSCNYMKHTLSFHSFLNKAVKISSNKKLEKFYLNTFSVWLLYFAV